MIMNKMDKICYGLGLFDLAFGGGSYAYNTITNNTSGAIVAIAIMVLGAALIVTHKEKKWERFG
jgi:hypothetical protein